MSIDGWESFDIPEKEITDQLLPSLEDYKKATSLVLSSGGVKGVYILGAMHYLYETCGIDHIQSFYGTSIGSVISGLLIIGFTPMEILVYICVHKIVNQLLQSFCLPMIMTEKRMLDASIFTTILTTMIESKIGFIPTLGELPERFGKTLCIVTISRNQPSEPLYLSSHTRPDLSLVSAIHMSCSIPFVFGYAKYDDVEYFDGGVLDQFPIFYASEREELVFGIDLIRTYQKNDTFWLDMFEVMLLPINFITLTLKKQLRKGSFIELHTDNEYVTKDKKDIMEMFISGYRQSKEKLPETRIKRKQKKE